MSAARLWVWVFGACFAVMAALWLWTLQMPPFEGDLTRVGRLSEKAFGPRDPQPTVPPALMADTPVAEADILVVGDSFSAPKAWQSRLVAAGWRVATRQVRNTVGWCADLPAWVRAQGFRGRVVILQSVERNVDVHFRRYPHCAKPKIPSASGPSAMAHPQVAGESFTTGMVSAFNTWRALSTTDERVIRGSGGGDRVRVRRMADGCQRFSHEACNWGLFFADDLDQAPLSATTLAHMQRLDAGPRDFALVWAIVPDKSSVYLAPQRLRSWTPILAAHGLGPDLMAALEATPGRDLYMPHDTHLSVTGQFVVGDTLLAWMRTRGLQPPQR